MISFVKNDYIEIEESIKNNFELFILKYSLLEQDGFIKINKFCFDEFYKDYEFVFENFIVKLHNLKEKLNNISIYDFFEELNKILSNFGSNNKLKQKIDEYRQNDILKFKQYSQIEDKIFECEKHLIDYYNQFLLLSHKNLDY